MYTLHELARMTDDRYHSLYGLLRDGTVPVASPPGAPRKPRKHSLGEAVAIVVVTQLRQHAISRESQRKAAQWCLSPDLEQRLADGHGWLIVTGHQVLAVREDSVLGLVSEGPGACVLVRVGAIVDRLREEAAAHADHA